MVSKPGATGVRRVINAFGYSLKGCRAAFKYESAFRQELAVCVLLVPLAFWIGKQWFDYVLLISTLIIVLMVELINSAIEAVVDRISSEQHELAGRAKDMASAAVLLALVLAAFVWGMVLYRIYF